MTLFSPLHFEKSQVGIPLRKMYIGNYLWLHRVERFFQCCNLICEPGLEAFWLCHFEFCLEVLQVSPQAWYVVKDPDMFVTRWDQTLALVIKQQTWMKWNLTSSLAKLFIDKYRYICNRSYLSMKKTKSKTCSVPWYWTFTCNVFWCVYVVNDIKERLVSSWCGVDYGNVSTHRSRQGFTVRRQRNADPRRAIVTHGI